VFWTRLHQNLNNKHTKLKSKLQHFYDELSIKLTSLRWIQAHLAPILVDIVWWRNQLSSRKHPSINLYTKMLKDSSIVSLKKTNEHSWFSQHILQVKMVITGLNLIENIASSPDNYNLIVYFQMLILKVWYSISAHKLDSLKANCNQQHPQSLFMQMKPPWQDRKRGRDLPICNPLIQYDWLLRNYRCSS